MELQLSGGLNGVKFSIGQALITRGVHEEILENKQFADFVGKSFVRHCNGDWGDLCKEDKELNDSALAHEDDRLFSKYNFSKDKSIYIITEWDRSATTILFPEEY